MSKLTEYEDVARVSSQEHRRKNWAPWIIGTVVAAGATYLAVRYVPEAAHHFLSHGTDGTPTVPHISGSGKPPVDVLDPRPGAVTEYPTMQQPFNPDNFDGHGIIHYNGQLYDTISEQVYDEKVQAVWQALHPNAQKLTPDQLHQLWEIDNKYGTLHGYSAAIYEEFSKGGVHSVEAVGNDMGDQIVRYDPASGSYVYRNFGEGFEGLKAAWESYDYHFDEQIAVPAHNDTVGFVFPKVHGHPNGSDLAGEIQKIMLRNNVESLQKAGLSADQILQLQQQAEQQASDSSLDSLPIFFYLPVGADTLAAS